MLRQDLIEPTISEWASNVVLMKKDGSLRFCIDYRRLNEFSHKDAYPLPSIDTCLDAMAEARWFSTFDLRAVYLQVQMDSASTEKTTIWSFGLTGSPATFQRLMDLVMWA